jgi:hypothetical protein
MQDALFVRYPCWSDRVRRVAVRRRLHAVAGADRQRAARIRKAGWFVGGSLGSGTLTYQGRTYPLGIGGLSAGFTFGASKTTLVGTARNLRQASDITGTYAAVGAGATVAGGARIIELRNGKGVVLSLQGASAGLSFDLDLSGMEITFR